MNKRGAAGADGVSPKLVTLLLNTPIIERSLRAAMNESLRNHSFPSNWKCAKIRAIPKPSPGEFRPISLLSVLGKLFEKVITLRM